MSTAVGINGRNLPAVMEPEQIDRGHPDRPVVRYTIGDMREIAETAAKSGMFPMNASQIMTLMLICEAEGLHPMQAMRRFHVIEGRPAMRADAMQAEFQRHGGRLRWIRSTADECEAEFSHPRHHPEPITVRVTLQELIDNEVALGKWDERERKRKIKDNYRKFPRSMLRARVISEGVRAVDPGVVVGIYTPEEVEDMRPAAIEVSAVEEPSHRSALRDAIDAARSRPAPVAAIEAPAPPRGEFGRWLDARLAEVNARWLDIARGAGIEPGDPINEHQVVNHLVSSWIEQELLPPEAVSKDGTPTGARDNRKARAQVKAAVEADADDVMAEVDEYLKNELVARSGLSSAGDDDEAQGLADEDPADGE